ncbi:MAG: hypothetical protein BEN19_01430 [Epulopiscium sp. Nuni2H_MBin003]|nr:MAG: hypothetical protein BEN19_01430 [Epulopiscium sp. Nuni2H_MBin003]
MATEVQIQYVMDMLSKNHPKHTFDRINKTNAGIFAVLKYLNEAQSIVCSKDISTALKVSTARMSVLLKKMEKQNLITKYADSNDSRITRVRLTTTGEDTIIQIKNHLYLVVTKIIDEIGFDEVTKCFATLEKIKQIMNSVDVLFKEKI